MRFGGTCTRRYCDLRPRSEAPGRSAGKDGLVGRSAAGDGSGDVVTDVLTDDAAAAAATSATLTLREVMYGKHCGF